MGDNPRRNLEVEHLVVGLVIKNLGTRLIAGIAQVEVVAGGAFMASANDRRVASVTGSRVNDARTGRWSTGGRRSRSHGLRVAMIWDQSYRMAPALLHVERRMTDGGTLDFTQAVHTQINRTAAITLVPQTLVGAPCGQRLDRLVADGRRRDNTNGVFDVHKHVHKRVIGHGEPVGVARVAKVKVRTDHALVTSAVDRSLTGIAFV